jgi:GTPase Era involved in 16S rRNA processing
MEVRKILSVIGNISTGKSSFLNYLLGSDILQTGNELKTRFIIIIRHTENKEPVLSHIKRNTSFYEDLYQKIEDNEGKIEYKGKKEIIKKINSLNFALKKVEDEGKLDYSKYLYLLEINIKNIHNQDFLYFFDLADIPGLNNNSKKKGDDTFGSIKKIFTPLKGLIQYGLLVFDANQYRGTNTTKIIKQLIAQIGIKINHFLIIFNKIDELPPEQRETTFLSFKANLKYYIGDDLLNNTNSIITMNTLKLLEEENVMQNFDNFLSYHFKGLTTDNYEKYFKRLVANGYYMNYKSAPRKKYSDIEKILDPDTELDEEFTEHITKIAENAGFKLNFDPDEENYENMCKLFSLLKKAFLKKDVYFHQIPSEYRKKIDEFFNNQDFIALNNEIIKKKDDINDSNKKNKENKIVNKELLYCIEQLKSFFNVYIKDLQSKTNKTNQMQRNINIVSLGERIENLEKLIVCHDKIRIVVYGTYNAGKSSTLNSLIGKDLLQVSNGQCTGKPILIRYSNKEKPEIYRAELKSIKDYDRFTHYAFKEKGKALAKGDEAVRDFINAQNSFVNNGMDETNEFFILKTRIQILDELNLSEEIKNNVEFLDTPGLNTDLMKNEGDLLQKLVEQTFIYLFIIDPKIGGADTIAFKNILENTMLKTIYNRSIVNDSKLFLKIY